MRRGRARAGALNTFRRQFYRGGTRAGTAPRAVPAAIAEEAGESVATAVEALQLKLSTVMGEVDAASLCEQLDIKQVQLRSTQLTLARAWKIFNEPLESNWVSVGTENAAMGYLAVPHQQLAHVIAYGFEKPNVTVSKSCSHAMRTSDEFLFCAVFELNLGTITTAAATEDKVPDGFQSAQTSDTYLLSRPSQALPKFVLLFQKCRKDDLWRQVTTSMPKYSAATGQGLVFSNGTFVCFGSNKPAFETHLIAAPTSRCSWRRLDESNIPTLIGLENFVKSKEITSGFHLPLHASVLANPANECAPASLVFDFLQ
eukprot:TRINITY_DN775_c0_g1_i2.p1 TRINITY_DN775_c0_g1~~TRINITY_DN775_c0_g1_i2.p1  ORF type:complete len:327 (+),score=56.61 TRINITY_DN775_c0_g1_i2:41-982(+)